MTYFKLDIPKLNEQISMYKSKKKECQDDIGFIYNGLGYVESAWNDNNSNVFIDNLKKDKYKVNEYFNYLDNLIEEISKFKNNIDSICYKQGYKTNSIVLKFDDTEIDNCKKALSSALTYLNEALNSININDFPSNFQDLNSVYTLRSEIKSIKDSISNLISDISNFVNLINNEIYDSNFRLKRISSYDFNLKPIEYNWQIVNMDVKTVNNELPSHSNINGATIDKVENSKVDLTKGINVYNSGINDINIKDSEKVTGLDNGLRQNIPSQSKIKLDENTKVDGINDDNDYYYAKDSNIKLNSNNTSISSDIYESNPKNANINLASNTTVDVSNNIDIYSSRNNRININTDNNLSSLNNIDEIKEINNSSINNYFNDDKE